MLHKMIKTFGRVFLLMLAALALLMLVPAEYVLKRTTNDLEKLAEREKAQRAFQWPPGETETKKIRLVHCNI